jgi:hypothetical protein
MFDFYIDKSYRVLCDRVIAKMTGMQDESENVVRQYEYARRVRDTSRLLFCSLCRHWQTRQQVLVGHTRTRHR